MTDKLTHLGFIADGNRRWAKARGLPTLEGHRRGFDATQTIVDALKDTEVKYISFFVFSTENWDRSEEEVAYLMKLIGDSIEKFAKRAQKENFRIVIIGHPEPVKPELWQKLQQLEQETSNNTGLTLCFCFNYGGQWEIADAATKLVEDVKQGKNLPEITPEVFAEYLYHPEIPPLDLIVRTSGEERLSGFMLWRAAYAELLFLEKNFPDIDVKDCEEILTIYHGRQRRFGK